MYLRRVNEALEILKKQMRFWTNLCGPITKLSVNLTFDSKWEIVSSLMVNFELEKFLYNVEIKSFYFYAFRREHPSVPESIVNFECVCEDEEEFRR